MRAILFQSKLPEIFWGEAAVTAAYFKNRWPNSAIKFQMPFEAWFGRILKLSHLRTFGCIIYIHIPHQRRQKLSKLIPPSTKGCLLGFISSTIYKYYDFERQCVDVSHNIIFKENEFPTPADVEHLLLQNQSSPDSLTEPIQSILYQTPAETPQIIKSFTTSSVYLLRSRKHIRKLSLALTKMNGQKR